jgi:hypothetical protein
MNADWVLFHLHEAREELTRMISQMESGDQSEEEFAIAITHLYNHLNTAWNSRHEPPERTTESSQRDFYAWRAFPRDIQMGREPGPAA